MNFSVSKKDINEAIKSVSKIIVKDHYDKWKESFCIHARNNIVEIQANNGDLSYIHYIPAEVETPINFVVNAKTFKEAIRVCKDDVIRFTFDDETKTVRIDSGTMKFNAKALDVKFPVVEEVEGDLMLTVSSEYFRNLINSTVHACSPEKDTRKIFTGCKLSVNGDKLSMIATNTNKINRNSTILIQGIQGESESVIVPAKTLKCVEKDLPKNGFYTDVNIVANQREIGFEFDNIYVKSRLIEGEFPATAEDMFLRDYTTEIRIKRMAFINAIERLMPFTSKTSDAIELDVKIGEIHLSAHNDEIGSDIVEIIPIQITGDEIKIHISAKMLIETLKPMADDFCRVSFGSNVEPIQIKESSDDMFASLICPCVFKK